MKSDSGFLVLDLPAWEVAPRLLGALFVRELPDGTRLSGRIVETEAYDQADSASHSYKGRTARTDVMFGPSGHLYVYFTYGMHYCCNVVTGIEGHGSAVLIRAIEPLEGIDIMTLNRGGKKLQELTNGPAKVCQALGIDRSMNGQDLRKPPITLELSDAIHQDQIRQTTRIGISTSKDVAWRFYLIDNQYVSRR